MKTITSASVLFSYLANPCSSPAVREGVCDATCDALPHGRATAICSLALAVLTSRLDGRLAARRLLARLLRARLLAFRLFRRGGRGVGRGSRRRLRGGLAEGSVVEGHVGLYLLVGDLRTRLAALRPALDGEGQVPAVDLLVVAEHRLVLALRAAHHALGVDLDG